MYMTLEREWNEKLADIERMERDATLRPRLASRLVDPAEQRRMLALARDLSKVWHSPTTPQTARKQLLGYLIKDVTLYRGGTTIQVAIRWQTPVPHGLPVELTRVTAWGFSCYVSLPCVSMPSPVPRRDRWDLSLMARPIPTGRPFPDDSGLPQVSGGSAPAYDFSRPLQRSHDITACLLATPPNGVFSRRLRRFCYLHRRSDSYRLERPLPGRICTY